MQHGFNRNWVVLAPTNMLEDLKHLRSAMQHRGKIRVYDGGRWGRTQIWNYKESKKDKFGPHTRITPWLSPPMKVFIWKLKSLIFILFTNPRISYNLFKENCFHTRVKTRVTKITKSQNLNLLIKDHANQFQTKTHLIDLRPNLASKKVKEKNREKEWRWVFIVYFGRKVKGKKVRGK